MNPAFISMAVIGGSMTFLLVAFTVVRVWGKGWAADMAVVLLALIAIFVIVTSLVWAAYSNSNSRRVWASDQVPAAVIFDSQSLSAGTCYLVAWGDVERRYHESLIWRVGQRVIVEEVGP